MIGATALVVSLVLTPLWQHLAHRLRLEARPGPRRVHLVATPTAGGVPVFIAIWTGLYTHSGGAFTGGGMLLWATAAIVVLGLADDMYDLKPGIKVAGQLVAALLFIVPAIATNTVPIVLDVSTASPWLDAIIVVAWLVATANMFNIIDGLDGLAGGVAVIATAPLLALAFVAGAWETVVLGAALIGAVLGFLRYNVHPARLFLGDAGGMLLGFIVGVLSLQTVAAVKSAASSLSPAVVLLAVTVPLFDTWFAVLRRWSRGQPLAQADAMHIHHRLLRHGLTTRQAVTLLYGVSIVTSAAAFVLARQTTWYSWAALLFCAFAALPWARRLGVLGSAIGDDGQSWNEPHGDQKIARLVSSESVEFREETGKFQGIAK